MNPLITARPNIGRILIAGFVATIILTLMMYFVAPMMTGAAMDIAGELSKMIGVPWMAGMVMHFMLGTVVFSLAYAWLVVDYLPGNAAVRGLLWGLILWMPAMLMVGPMIGKGLFMGSMPGAVSSLVGHLAFGLALGLIIDLPRSRS